MLVFHTMFHCCARVPHSVQLLFSCALATIQLPVRSGTKLRRGVTECLHHFNVINWYYVFSVRCRASVVPLLFISCTSAVHLLSPCCSSHVLLFYLSSTSCTSLALFKFLYSSPAFHLRTLRRSQYAL